MNNSQNAWEACRVGLDGATATWRAQRWWETAVPSAVSVTVAAEHPKNVLFCSASSTAYQRGNRPASTQEVWVSPGDILLLIFPLLFLMVGFVKGKGLSFLKPSAAESPLRNSSNPVHAGGKKYEPFWRPQLKVRGFSLLPSPPSRGTKFS